MKTLLPLVFAAPLASALLLMVFGGGWSRRTVAWTGCGSVGVSAVAVLILASIFWAEGAAHSLDLHLWRWIQTDTISVTAGFHLDALSLVMAFVITFVGFFIHLYSTEFMAGEPGYGRFFAWLNLFVAAMLVVVFADDLLFLFMGWELVGLCSYLLIGFWYREPANGYAGRKAFIMTRVGDTALLLGILYLQWKLGTSSIAQVSTRAAAEWNPGAFAPSLAALLLLGGALGKSAQFPLHTWLPDAMAGPTPVSALIHAATMVTAGVYLIARLHDVFALAPAVQMMIAIIGAVTLLLGAFSALAQRDIKRVLAYSTMSQIGYMFVALGVGAWSAALFHLFTHAFFKALLFLAAGAVILAMDHEHDIFKMGGLRRRLPSVYLAFIAGGASLAALPLFTAGFFSKELIFATVWSAGEGGRLLWLAAWVGAVVTAAYVGRLIDLVFHGKGREAHYRSGVAMALPLGILGVGAIFSGDLQWPSWLGPVRIFTEALQPVFGTTMPSEEAVGPALAAAMAPFVGWLAWRLLRRPASASTRAQKLAGFLRDGWGFDSLYAFAVERPWVTVARHGSVEIVDGVYRGITHFHRGLWRMLSTHQNGLLRRYVGSMVIGVVFLLLAALL